MPRFISLSYDSHITIGYVSLVSFTTTITLCGTLGSALVDREIFLKDGDSRGSLDGSQAITPMPLTTNDAELDPNRMAWSSSLEAVSKLNPMRMPSISSLAKRTRSPPFPFPSNVLLLLHDTAEFEGYKPMARPSAPPPFLVSQHLVPRAFEELSTRLPSFSDVQHAS
jgi:hypothetical protein